MCKVIDCRDLTWETLASVYVGMSDIEALTWWTDPKCQYLRTWE